jgi:hypothetical protein
MLIDTVEERHPAAFGGASYVLGCLLDAKGDRDGALAGYLRADDQGDGNGAFNLGIELMERDDLQGAEAALRVAHWSAALPMPSPRSRRSTAAGR